MKMNPSGATPSHILQYKYFIHYVLKRSRLEGSQQAIYSRARGQEKGSIPNHPVLLPSLPQAQENEYAFGLDRHTSGVTGGQSKTRVNSLPAMNYFVLLGCPNSSSSAEG
jgi:hypothetical protein